MIRAVAVIALAAGCRDDGGPRLDSVMPAQAPRAAMVTLAGSRLCGASADCSDVPAQVQFGLDGQPALADVVSYTATAAEVIVPGAAPIGSTEIVVMVGDQSSNALPFEVTQP
ncbi:MAG TPA: hypothetical protein VLX92_17455 [Kofleriaceae bacterium]|nr:hypothetical protein [Kofleriaceae bacterium]